LPRSRATSAATRTTAAGRSSITSSASSRRTEYPARERARSLRASGACLRV
jgi:hypothetical protein